jgi:hypothetical protein
MTAASNKTAITVSRAPRTSLSSLVDRTASGVVAGSESLPVVDDASTLSTSLAAVGEEFILSIETSHRFVASKVHKVRRPGKMTGIAATIVTY